nr:reverse transcriptase domain-containing protein [Tanacetum cinerariifolium]
TALITVLKSHKRAIAWKLSDIKGIDLEFYTHKILMEEVFEPAVQHQRTVNPKIHDVIKQEVLKLLDAGFIYPISDSPWTAGDHRKVQLNELNELCDQAYENSLIYKEKTKRLHDSKIKDRVFIIGDRVLLFNSRLNIFSGKLKSCWSGPFTITHVFLYGTVELSQTDGPNFKVNGHRLKHYFGEDIPKMVVSDLQTFPKDQ